MKKLISAVTLAVFAFAAIFAADDASADDMKMNGIMVEQPWARATAGPAKAGAAYMTLVNHGDETDRLVGAKSDLAKRTEIHTHLMENGVMKMRQVEGVEVEPGTPTVFQPGGLHVMFMGLKAPFKEGQELPLTLVFEKAGEISVTFKVQGVGASKPMQGHGQHKNQGS
ncbi:MAG: copper chaperone PCu(A)C [Rhodospirillales bacterium]|nr:copper chaperone PCu(A)C [Rhodospirillales bacterium]MBO6785784.1 copper chaperone PCu(A)C [Rhodospirillales bacterium]